MTSVSLLTASVGTGGVNRTPDVRIVQRLLNDWLTNNGGVQLKVDGIVGPKTSAAITAFQRGHVSIVDGRLDPGGPTINALFKGHIAELVRMIDVSRLSQHLNAVQVNQSSLSDSVVAAMIDRYVSVLKKEA